MLVARWILRPVSLGVFLPLPPLFFRGILFYIRSIREEVPRSFLSSSHILYAFASRDLRSCDSATCHAVPKSSRRPKRGKKESYRPSMSTSDKVPRPSYTGTNRRRIMNSTVRPNGEMPDVVKSETDHSDSGISVIKHLDIVEKRVIEMECWPVTGTCLLEKCTKVVFPLVV